MTTNNYRITHLPEIKTGYEIITFLSTDSILVNTKYITCTKKNVNYQISIVLFTVYYLGNSFSGICFEGSFTHKLHSMSLPASSDSSEVSAASRGFEILLS